MERNVTQNENDLNLHANDGIYEKQHGDEQTDVRKSLQDKSRVKLIKRSSKDRCALPQGRASVCKTAKANTVFGHLAYGK